MNSYSFRGVARTDSKELIDRRLSFMDQRGLTDGELILFAALLGLTAKNCDQSTRIVYRRCLDWGVPNHFLLVPRDTYRFSFIREHISLIISTPLKKKIYTPLKGN